MSAVLSLEQRADALLGVASDAPACVLADVESFIRRFCALPSEADYVAVTLWAAHAHMVPHFHTTPRLALLSPEPGSGKTRVLEVLELLTPNTLFAFSASVPAIFRTLASKQTTLLFDEVDTVFGKRGKDDQNEDLRALLNAGYRRGARIPRCVGAQHEVRQFDVFAAVALAGLGDLPDTVMTRSVIVRMRRRAPNEHVEPFRARTHEPQGHALCNRLAQWAEQEAEAIGSAEPDLPVGIVDRPAEVWEPLIAVAEAAGDNWPERAHAACIAICGGTGNRAVSLGVRLLTDLRQVFGQAASLSTARILELLKGDALGDAAPWATLHGEGLDARGLARLLSQYGIQSTKIWAGDASVRGYKRADMWDAWERYCPAVTSPEVEGSEGGECVGGAPLNPSGPSAPSAATNSTHGRTTNRPLTCGLVSGGSRND